MSKARLTIVDEDPHTLELMRRILEKEEYRVNTETSATAALINLEQDPPDLIITELQLADMTGFDFLKTLNAHHAFQNIPIIVLSARRDADDKLKAKELGAKAYLAKPFQRQEFLNQVDALLLPTPAAKTEKKGIHNSAETVIQKLTTHHIQNIQPQIDNASAFGYDYLCVVKFLDFQNNHQAMTKFDEMVNSGFLNRKLFDVIHLCPYCDRHQINFREVCPGCNSLNIWIQMFYLHKQCGSQTWKSSQLNSKIISCAKCGQVLTRPNPEVEIGYAYRCSDCGRDFFEININCRCLCCGKVFDISEAIKKEIFSYQVVETIHKQVIPPSPNVSKLPASALLSQILETRTHIYLPIDELAKKLDLEILRAKRHQNSITLISIEFVDFFNSLNLLPTNLTSPLINDFVKLINHSLRKNDTLSLKNETQLIILLPQTHQNIAKIIGHKILHDLESFNDKIQLEMKLASYPEDGINSEEILNVLDLGLEKLNEQI